MVNKAMILGNVGQDPELRDTGKSPVVNLSIATNRKWTNKDGEKHEETEWHRVVFFGKRAETIARYTKKGDKLYVEGRLQTRSYEKDGVKKYSTEIIGENFSFVGSGGGRSTGGEGAAADTSFDFGNNVESAETSAGGQTW
jgi:single-strand DNA-binding protein